MIPHLQVQYGPFSIFVLWGQAPRELHEILEDLPCLVLGAARNRSQPVPAAASSRPASSDGMPGPKAHAFGTREMTYGSSEGRDPIFLSGGRPCMEDEGAQKDEVLVQEL